MIMYPFYLAYPKLAENETRVLHFLKDLRGVPAGDYVFIESYCPDPACDCRRVMVEVRKKPHYSVEAHIALGLDRDDENPGPYLDPLNEQGEHAEALLEAFRGILLTDDAYMARLGRHYRAFKAAVADPSHAVHERIRQYDERIEANASSAPSAPETPAARRNEPCPCGSGRKYKRCCGSTGRAPPQIGTRRGERP